MKPIYSNEELLKMYRNLKRGRIFTLKAHECVNNGLIRSSFHTPYGQEAVGVGIASALKENDWINLKHRLQTAMIMKFSLEEFLGELFGLKSGYVNGSGFDFHLCDYDENGRHVSGGTAVLGGTIPLNVGFAWARKRLGKDDVCVIACGDGECSEGGTFEGWNIAALYQVPAVFVIDNNQWAMTVPLERQTANPNICEKAAACGIPDYQIVDGNDILAVRKAMDDAIELARKGTPNIVEIKTLRWDAHFVGQGNDYRHDKDMIAESMKNDDCVKRYEEYLLTNGIVDQAYIDKVATEVEDEIDTAIKNALAAEKPSREDIYRKEYIYATPETGGDL